MKHLSLFAFIILLSLRIFSQAAPSYYFVMLNTNHNKPKLSEEEVNRIQVAHLANMDSLANIGQLVATGPFHGGGGLFIFRAGSLESVDKMLKSDPAVKANRFTTELYPLQMILGSVCPQKDDYEMAEYQFIKYSPVAEKINGASEKKYSKLNTRHTKFFTENIFSIRLIAAGNFGSSNGGFLITEKIDEEKLERLLMYDPWVKSGYFTSTLKVLWIAEGSFCENDN
ncbi:MAG: hypothetical protein B6I19_08225 [Bacteroidetes bacterium 4572_114]|nr:MAG: hypothetical protein B6I19_08225 [Bacteroidetes bacterium 4572_114]